MREMTDWEDLDVEVEDKILYKKGAAEELFLFSYLWIHNPSPLLERLLHEPTCDQAVQ